MFEPLQHQKSKRKESHLLKNQLHQKIIFLEKEKNHSEDKIIFENKKRFTSCKSFFIFLKIFPLNAQTNYLIFQTVQSIFYKFFPFLIQSDINIQTQKLSMLKEYRVSDHSSYLLLQVLN